MTDVLLTLAVDDEDSIQRAIRGLTSMKQEAGKVADGVDKSNTTTGKLASGFTAVARGVGLALTGVQAISKALEVAKGYAQEISDQIERSKQKALAGVPLQALEASGGVEAGASRTVLAMKSRMQRAGLDIPLEQLQAAAAAVGSAAQGRGVSLEQALTASTELWARSGFEGDIEGKARQVASFLKTGEGDLQGVFIDPTAFQKAAQEQGGALSPQDKAKMAWKMLWNQVGGASTLKQLLTSGDEGVQAYLAQLSRQTAASEIDSGMSGAAALRDRFATDYQRQYGFDPSSFWTSLLRMRLGGWAKHKMMDPTSTIMGAWFRLFSGGDFEAGLNAAPPRRVNIQIGPVER